MCVFKRRVEDTSIIRSPLDGVVTVLNYYAGESAPPQATILRVEDLSDRFIEVALEQEGALQVLRLACFWVFFCVYG